MAFAELFEAAAQSGEVGREAIAQAERLAGLAFSDAERDLMLPELLDQSKAFAGMREQALANDVPLALQFRPDAFTEEPRAVLRDVLDLGDGQAAAFGRRRSESPSCRSPSSVRCSTSERSPRSS